MRDMKNTMNKWPKGLQEVYVVCDQCVKHLINHGVNPSEAEDSVLEVLKEYDSELTSGKYSVIKDNLRYVFLNENLTII